MQVMGKVTLFFVMSILLLGCSTHRQLQSSNDTNWSEYYQRMHDSVQQNHPEMDHVIVFCNEMIQYANQYEQNAMSREEFAGKQKEMRALLQKEDDYRRQIAWQQEGGPGPFEQYLASKSGGENVEETNYAWLQTASVP